MSGRGLFLSLQRRRRWQSFRDLTRPPPPPLSSRIVFVQLPSARLPNNGPLWPLLPPSLPPSLPARYLPSHLCLRLSHVSPFPAFFPPSLSPLLLSCRENFMFCLSSFVAVLSLLLLRPPEKRRGTPRGGRKGGATCRPFFRACFTSSSRRRRHTIFRRLSPFSAFGTGWLPFLLTTSFVPFPSSFKIPRGWSGGGEDSQWSECGTPLLASQIKINMAVCLTIYGPPSSSPAFLSSCAETTERRSFSPLPLPSSSIKRGSSLAIFNVAG